MKKIITFLMAATMIFGFAGVAMAADTCATCVEPGTINRACPEEQDLCESLPFDYEDADHFYNEDQDYIRNYCDTLIKKDRRVLFPACDCENFEEGDTIDIRMEILVNGQTGKSTGKAPYSPLKIIATIAVIIAMVLLAIVLLAGLGGIGG